MTESDNGFDLERGEAIRNRRNMLDLSVEEAAIKAGVTAKSWYRYESGSPIRADKLKNVLEVLRWQRIEYRNDGLVQSVETHVDGDWGYSKYLENTYDRRTAQLVATACECVKEEIKQAIAGLSEMPTGSHIGELPYLDLYGLPELYLTRYNHEFMCKLMAELHRFVLCLSERAPKRTALNEIIAVLLENEILVWLDLEPDLTDNCALVEEYDANLVYMLFDDRDVDLYFSDDAFMFPLKDNVFHFDCWFDDTEF